MEGEESILCRHYSTIGIGDVFVSPPCHPFPRTYLSQHSEERSTDSAKFSQETSSFLSWEILGTIKASPEDFIVREIAPKAKNIHGLNNNEQSEAYRVADLQLSLPERDVAEQACTEPCRAPPVAKNPVPETSEKVLSASSNRSLSDLLQEMTQSPEEILEKLNQLSRAAVDALEKTGSTERVDTDLSSCVEFPLDAKNSIDKTSDELAVERAAFYRAFHLAFPLLQSETKSEERLSERGTLSKDYRVHVKIDTRFFGVVPYLYSSTVDVPDLYLFYKRGYEAAKKSLNHRKQNTRDPFRLNNGGGAVLRLRPDLPRSERRIVHEILDKGSNRLLGSSTIPDYQFFDSLQKEQLMTAAIIVKWSKLAERRMSRKRMRDDRRSGNSSTDRGRTFLFVLKKRGKEHLAAIKTLVMGLKCVESDIGLAGIKDMCAITYQFCTVSNVTSERILRSRKFLQDRGMDISTPVPVDWRLEKGNLEGNRFQITLRDMERVAVNQGNDESVPLELSHLQDMVDRVRLHGFVNFYGEQRVGIPGTEAIAGVRSFDIGRAMLQEGFTKAIDLLMTGRRHIHGNTTESPDIQRFREIWKSSGGDPSESWKALPRGAILLRERAVLRGLKRYGKDKPLEALRCLHRNERTLITSAYQSYVWNRMATERLQRLGTRVVKGDLVQGKDGSVISVANDLSNWTIYNVVLPLPGYGVTFPTNVIGELYAQLLEHDGIRLTKDSLSDATSRGSYRKVVAIVSNIKLEPIQLDTGRKHVSSAKISFDLPKGSYATMLLRELMLTTIDRLSDNKKGTEEDTT